MDNDSTAPLCGHGNDLIAFLYGEAGEREARDFERHLRICADCQSEIGNFKQIRESIISWRDESLGSLPSSAPVTTGVTNSVEVKPSALVAVRQFLSFSPVWLKGAVAFASVLFCVAAVLSVLRLSESSPPPVAINDEKLYTGEELATRIEEAVQSRIEELEAQRKAQDNQNISTVTKGTEQRVPPRRKRPRQPAPADAATAQRRPLTKSEREQLAADLRLISPNDEMGPELLVDRINQ